MEKYLWTYTTSDKYELPLVVADSATELSEMTGINMHTICSAIHLARKRGTNSQYHKVFVGEEYECKRTNRTRIKNITTVL